MQGEKRYEAGKSIFIIEPRKRREEKREFLEILRFLFSKGELGISLD